MLAVEPERLDRQVPAVVHREAGGPQPLEQAGRAQRGRRLLDARRVRAGSRRRADQADDPLSRGLAARAARHAGFLASLISSRWPSGSRKKARTSHSYSTGGVRKAAPARQQGLIRGAAVRHADRHLVVDGVRVARRRERDVRLVWRRTAAGHEQQPRAEEAQDHGRAAVLPVELGPEHVDVEGAGASHVADHQQVRQLHAVLWERAAHDTPLAVGMEATYPRPPVSGRPAVRSAGCGPPGSAASPSPRGRRRTR